MRFKYGIHNKYFNFHLNTLSIDFDYYIEDHKRLKVTEQADLGNIISNDLIKPSNHIAKVGGLLIIMARGAPPPPLKLVKCSKLEIADQQGEVNSRS